MKLCERVFMDVGRPDTCTLPPFLCIIHPGSALSVD